MSVFLKILLTYLTLKDTATLPPQRVSSVDAYRGFVMFLMMAEVLRLSRVAEAYPDSAFWAFLDFHQSHVPWVGCSLHDLIQPSFSFLVGVALPYSMASRASKNQTVPMMWFHTIRRSLILILLGIFLRSMHSEQTNFTFEDTLTQIGLGYPILFALGFATEKIRRDALIWGVLAVILVGYAALFALYPLPGPDFDWSQTGTTADWEHNLTGFAAHWNKNTNAAWAFDRWFLNLFPREKPFEFNGGGYSTLSFIPTLGTMILGLIAGKWLKSAPSSEWLLKRFAMTAGILFALALILHFTGLNPIVKRIWTPAWTLFSGGCAFLLLSAFYFVVDVKDRKSSFFWLIVIGTNSIAAYLIADGFGSFIRQSFKIHLGQRYDAVFGDGYASLVSGALILLVMWLILRWMYKKKIFIKI
ncbi:acyltransferase family protein [Dyadobacter beijingensis]|uniref:acyltransferase family protein n=1 Tax=Dyadobacter beijingensis TaxID=365489 RepID=UPI0035B652EF